MNDLHPSGIGPDARLSIARVARTLGFSPKSIARWARVGVRGVILPTVRVGGRVFVLNADLKEFLAAINREPDDRSGGPPILPLAGRRRTNAEAACNRAGI